MTGKKQTKDSSSPTLLPKGVTLNNTKKLKNESPGIKILQMISDENGKTMMDFSPFLVQKVIENVGGVVNETKMLSDRSLLIETKDLKQANKIIQICSLADNMKVVVIEENKFNTSKGVIYAPQLLCVSDDQLLIDLQSQFVSQISRLEVSRDGIKKANGIFFVTFATPELPEKLNAGYLRLEVRPYVPKPTQCFDCGRFGHVSKYCKVTVKQCLNCSSIQHSEDKDNKCSLPSTCINCRDHHHTLNRRQCTRYQEEATIIKVRVTQKITHKAAAEIVRGKPTLQQRPAYAKTVSNTPAPQVPRNDQVVAQTSNKTPAQDRLVKATNSDITPVKSLLLKKAQERSDQFPPKRMKPSTSPDLSSMELA